MKTHRSAIIVTILAFLGLVFVACGNLNKTEYTVTFESNGGSVVNSQIVTVGETAVRPANPTKDGFVFNNWYANAGLTVVYNFNTPVNSDITLYAKWNPENTEPGDDPDDSEDPEEPGDSEDPEDPENPGDNPGTNPGITYYTITFETFGGSEVPSQGVAYGDRAARPENPENGFYYFNAWYTNAEFTQYYYFEETVTADTTIYARWSFDSYLFKSWLEAQSGGNSPDDPVVLALQYDTSLASVLYGLGGRFGDPVIDKYVSLDFSNCTTVDGVFDGNSNNYPGITRIVSVVMPDSATTINGNMSSPVLKSVSGKSLEIIEEIIEGTFSGCTALTDVDFPNLKTISGGAFRNCTALTNVDFPNLITIEGSAYGYGAFEGCIALTSINFPNLICIGDGSSYGYGGAFGRCTSLVSVNLPKITSVGSSAFSECTSLTDVNFPNATSIGACAFAGDKYNPNLGLENVYLPKVTSIGKNAFADCTALTTVSLSANASIDEYVFLRCPSISFFEVIGAGPLRTIEGGKALVRDTELIAYPTASGNIEISNITSISNYAFYNCKNLTSVRFPDVITIEDPSWSRLDYATFAGCTMLQSIDFPKVESIGHGAFLNCALTSVNFSEATSIGDCVFEGCNGLNTVNIPKIEHIGDLAFLRTIPTTTTITITMGNAAPTVGTWMFGQNYGRYVIVKVPAGATGYGSIPSTYSSTNNTNNWGNAFRGMGWDGTSYGNEPISSTVTLNIVYQ